MKRYLLLVPATVLLLATNVSGAQTPVEVINTQVHITFTDQPSIPDPALLARITEELHGRQLASFGLKTEAKAATTKGDYTNAFSLLHQALSLDPDDGETRLRLTYFYIQKNQPENVIATLGPIVNPPVGVSNSVGNDINTQMLYILALLDLKAWPEAVACYEKSRQSGRMRWSFNGGGPERPWSHPKFKVDAPDFAGLYAYAHLVLGTSAPSYIEEKDQAPFMLGHLQQLLQINPNSFDAAFASGCLYRKLERFADARTAHAYASRLASPAERKEINEELKKLKTNEDSAKRFQAYQAALAAKAK